MSGDGSKIPLIEHFGPVVQGEGQLIGLPTWFVRLGGCDYTCFACDSMHAVDSRLIAKNATVMSALDIARKVDIFIGSCPMITLSGGNPALWDMTEFVDYFHAESNIKIAIETQGTVFQDWIRRCDYITISPKGPNMIGVAPSKLGIIKFGQFMEQLLEREVKGQICAKIPVFDSTDLDFAAELRAKYPAYPLYLSIGNSWVPPPAPHGILPLPAIDHMRMNLLERYIKMSEILMAQYPTLAACPILPQMHVLCYGNELRK